MDRVPSSTSNRTARDIIPKVLGASGLVWTGLGVVIAALMAIFEPSYFGPMLSSGVGLAMVATAAILIAGGVAMTLVAIRWMKKGGGWLVAGVVAVIGVVLAQFFTFWIVMLGPAILILLKPGQS